MHLSFPAPDFATPVSIIGWLNTPKYAIDLFRHRQDPGHDRDEQLRAQQLPDYTASGTERLVESCPRE
jgi:hypothetical protein